MLTLQAGRSYKRRGSVRPPCRPRRWAFGEVGGISLVGTSVIRSEIHAPRDATPTCGFTVYQDLNLHMTFIEKTTAEIPFSREIRFL